ncbi:MAG: citrate lyase acyl carrier protein [Clostridiales bacterium]|nr:citrate lyase acyl carrier protein [Clostridiales bacterium]
MQLIVPAIAGTLESSDVQVTIEAHEDGIEVNIVSDVIKQFGRQIRQTVLETLESLGIDKAKVSIVDKGALDCTLRARVECAVYRACQVKQGYPWGGAVK